MPVAAATAISSATRAYSIRSAPLSWYRASDTQRQSQFLTFRQSICREILAELPALVPKITLARREDSFLSAFLLTDHFGRTYPSGCFGNETCLISGAHTKKAREVLSHPRASRTGLRDLSIAWGNRRVRLPHSTEPSASTQPGLERSCVMCCGLPCSSPPLLSPAARL